MHALARFAALLTLLAVVSPRMFSQTETGSISGTVTDPSGAVVTNATVTAKNTATGAVRTATTSSAGTYLISNLPPGPYEVSISASGFAEFKQAVTVTVASHNSVSPRLVVAQAGITVEVSAGVGAVQVETQSSAISTMITSQQVSELPSLTRNPYDFVTLAGNGNVNQGEMYSPRGANGMALNGQRPTSTDILLDGGENVNLFDTTVGQQVPLDSVQELRVTSSNFGAEYGRASGGIVNVATKSGTNKYHGSAYEFNRLSSLATNTYDNNANDIPRAPFTRNQFGFSVGGPILHNELFFYNATEWVRVRGLATNLAYIPDPAFIASSAPNTQQYFQTFGKLEPGTQFLSFLTAGDLVNLGVSAPGSRVSALPPATPVLDLINYRFNNDNGGGPPQNTTDSVSRIDYNISSKTQLFGRYAIFSDDLFAGFNSASAYVGFSTGQTDLNQNILLSLTHTLNNNLLSNTKISYNRLTLEQPEGSIGTAPGLLIGLGGNGYTVNGQVNLLPGYLPYAPGAALPFGGPQNVFEVDQSFSMTHGVHNFKVGAEYVYIQDNRVFGAYENGIQYLSTGVPGTAYDNLLDGQLYRASVAIYPQGEFPCFRNPISNDPIQTPQCTLTGPATSPNFSRSNRYNDFAAYVQDSWRVRPRLTVNLGLRWEYFGVQHDRVSTNNANFVLGPGVNIYQQVQNGFVTNGGALPGGRLWQPNYTNFGPRIGIAYDVFGNGKTSFRAGYGIAYERNFGNVTYNVIQNPPNYAVLSIQVPLNVATLPITTNNFGAAGQPGNFPFRSPTLRAVDNNIKTAYANVWSTAVEHQVLPNTVFAIEYAGTRGIHGYTIQSYNDIGYGPTYTGIGCGGVGGAGCANAFQQLNQQYNFINYRTNGNDSWHNAMNLRLSSSNLWNQGVSLTANYTWSHTIDYLSATFGGSDEFGAQALGTLNPFNPQLDKGDSDFDIRNRLALSAVWELPYAKDTHGANKIVLDGWSFAPIVYANSGYPYTIYDCTNADTAYTCPRYIPSGRVATTGNTSTSFPFRLATPNTFAYQTIPAPLVYGSIYGGNGSVPTCASNPATGLTLATDCVFPSDMTSRNQFRQAGYWMTNFGIYKSFFPTEKLTVQFRLEMYNVFNHSNYYVQTGNVNAIGGLADVANLLSQPGITPNFATGTNNGEIEFTNASGAPAPYTIVGKKGVQNQAAAVGTGSLGERRFLQFALRLMF